MAADQSRPTSARYPTSEQMMDVAVTSTGLTDFGAGDFREGLDVDDDADAAVMGGV